MNKDKQPNKENGMGDVASIAEWASRSKNTEKVKKIPLEQLSPNQHQPRQRFFKDSLEELAESIAQQGLIQPIVVRTLDKNAYEIIAGERRFRAHQLLYEKGVESAASIAAIVKDVDDNIALAMALSENIDREDMSLADEVEGVMKLIELSGMKKGDVAELLGKNASWVSYRVSLAEAPKVIRQFMDKGYTEDAQSLWALSSLYKKHEEAANQLIQRWNDDPEVRSSLRTQVSKILAAMEHANQQAQHEEEFLLTNEPEESYEFPAKSTVKTPKEKEVVDKVINEVVQPKQEQEKVLVGHDLPPLFEIPAIIVNELQEDSTLETLVLDTNEGVINLVITREVVTKLRDLLEGAS